MMQDYFSTLLNSYNIHSSNMIAIFIILLLMATIATVIHFILHKIVLKNINIYHSTKNQNNWVAYLLKHKLFDRLAFVLQGLLIYLQSTNWLNSDVFLRDILSVGSVIWVLIFITLSLFSVLDVLLSLTQKNGLAKKLPIRGINQSLKIIISVFTAIFIISVLVDRSPLLLLSGLGAMTAIIMFVFKDPLLGLVAGILLSVNKMLNIGDWLEMPKYGADGDVIDITLTTVKVQNWDKTITNIPTYALISDSFKNWQGMTDSGGRRIKRSLYIDATSVRFLTSEECDKLKDTQLLNGYIENKINEITHYNETNQVNTNSKIEGRHLTNLGTFRAYLELYLRNHSQIRQNMTLMVRQLSPTSDGLPLEIYAFTNTTQWTAYENIQSDIFDHIFAVIPEFGLRIHQTPTGNDIQKMGALFKS